MDKAFSLFRVFDISFFAPGLLMFLLLRDNQWLSKMLPGLDSSIATSGGLLSIVTVVGLIYVLGLLVHAVQEALQEALQSIFRWKRSQSEKPPSWYASLTGNPQADFATYFWYMRATCWNLATACVIGSFLLWGQIGECGLLLIVPATLLLFLGRVFNEAMHRAAKASAAPGNGGQSN